MIWRSAIIAGYVALAAVVTVAYGARGLATLLFFYFCAGSWVAFVVAWGWVARAAAQARFRGLSGVR